MACDDCNKVRRALRQLAGAAATGRHATHLQVFRGLARAHQSGALGDIAAGGLGSLEPGNLVYSAAEVDAEREAFDGRLNAWLTEYEAAAGRLSPALVQQVDDFVQRWRDLRASLYDGWFRFQKTRAEETIALEGEWNRLRAQVAAVSGGAGTSIGTATVSVDGHEVDADKVPAGSSTIDRVESIAKWAAILVGGVAVLKVASDLGAFASVRKLISGRASNPRRWAPTMRPQPDDLCAARIDRMPGQHGPPEACGRPRASHWPCRGAGCTCGGTHNARLCHPFVAKRRNPRRRAA